MRAGELVFEPFLDAEPPNFFATILLILFAVADLLLYRVSALLRIKSVVSSGPAKLVGRLVEKGTFGCIGCIGRKISVVMLLVRNMLEGED